MRSDECDVSVVIPAKDAALTIAAQLDALSTQTCHLAWEVVVADNGSTDRTAQIASSYCDRLQLRVIDASAAPGAAAARNIGACAARGRRLVFADADDVVGSGWLAAHVGTSAALATGPIPTFRHGHPPQWPESGLAGCAPTLLGFRPYCSGANFGIDREVFDALRGFDPTFLAGEDVELSWRAQLLGYQVQFLPHAVVAKREVIGWKPSFRRYLRNGRFDPLLYRDFRDSGVPKPAATRILRVYLGLLARLPLLLHRESRETFARQLGRRSGRLIGSIEHGVFFL